MSKKDTESVADLVERITPILSGHSPEVQSAALADLTAMWLSGMQTGMSLAGLPDKDLEAFRAELFDTWCETVRELVAPNVAMLRERLEREPSIKCTQCGNTDPSRFETVVKSTGYIPRSYDGLRAYGGGHGSAELKGWRCLDCGTANYEHGA